MDKERANCEMLAGHTLNGGICLCLTRQKQSGINVREDKVGLHSLSPTMLSGTLYSSVVEAGLTPSANKDDREGTRSSKSGNGRLSKSILLKSEARTST